MFNGAPAVTPAPLLDWEEADGGEHEVGAPSPQAAVAVVLLAEAEVAPAPALAHAASKQGWTSVMEYIIA